MEAMVRRVVVLAVALGLTWMVFFGANYFGAVWTHYFADEPPKSTGEVSVKIIRVPPPCIGCRDVEQPAGAPRPPNPKPHG